LAELRKAYAEWRALAERLKQELSLAEERLANYAQENGRLNAFAAEQAAVIEQMSADAKERAQEIKRLRALLTQAPIAKVTVRESGAGHYAPDEVSVSLYAPGLPPGEYDLYLMPDVPQSEPTK
jgi:hypothetical protein